MAQPHVGFVACCPLSGQLPPEGANHDEGGVHVDRNDERCDETGVVQRVISVASAEDPSVSGGTERSSSASEPWEPATEQHYTKQQMACVYQPAEVENRVWQYRN